MASPRCVSALLLSLALGSAGAAHAQDENAIFISLQPGTQSIEADGQGRGAAIDALTRKIAKSGHLRVIVELKMPARTVDALSADRPGAVATLRTVQADVLQRVWNGRSGANARRFQYGPFLALSIDAPALKRLLADRDVVNIQEDTELSADGNNYDVTKIKAPKLWQLGIRGTGYAVAVLDTGVQADHPMLAGKVVSQACYSTNDAPNTSSFCPGGKGASTAQDSGKYCPLDIDGCEHGTHVAGTAAGRLLSQAQGVARGSDVIAIQVFHKGLNAETCSGRPFPCPRSSPSNIMAGLERVYALRKTYKIAAINISIGGGQYASHCDHMQPGVTHIIKLLKEAGIATVVSSANNGFTGSIASPACISYAIPVGSTNEKDAVSSFSNHSKLIALMAPGEKIVSAVPGDKYATLNGTSMAAPHVAGAFALLRQSEPRATVDQILEALEGTGVPVKRGGIVKPRIDLLGAFDALAQMHADGAVR